MTRAFGTMPKGLSELVDWLGSHRVTAAVLEGTGVYWLAPHDALSDAGIEPRLVHAQRVKQVKGRKTDVSDSLWRGCASSGCATAVSCRLSLLTVNSPEVPI